MCILKQKIKHCYNYPNLTIMMSTANVLFSLSLFFFFFFWPNPQHMEIPRLGVESELQLPVYTTAVATSDLSSICNLHHSSWQCQILNPLIKARDQTHNLMVPSQIRFLCVTGTPQIF